jgi:hypothetical protein
MKVVGMSLTTTGAGQLTIPLGHLLQKCFEGLFTTLADNVSIFFRHEYAPLNY